jgi:hypothetical protein
VFFVHETISELKICDLIDLLFTHAKNTNRRKNDSSIDEMLEGSDVKLPLVDQETPIKGNSSWHT